jgi:hypothetical protein
LPLFDRTCSVLIGNDQIEEGWDNLGIHGLRVKFTVNKTIKENTATIEIYNMSKDSRVKVSKTGQLVILRAGYRQDQGEAIIYRGNIVVVNHIRSNPDVITKIESDDGIDTLAKTKVILSYGPNTSAKSVLRDIISKSPLPKNLKSTIDSIIDKNLNNGFQSAGPIRDSLNKICALLGTQWTIQDSALKIIKQGDIDGARQVLLSSETGLLGSPMRVVDAIKKPKKDGPDKPGWEVKALLQPYLEPGSPVAIESEEIPKGSQFRCESVTHTGDTHSQEWFSKLVVVAR